MDAGDPARVEIGLIKVVGAAMLHNVIDRAIQVLRRAGRHRATRRSSACTAQARFARIYDGPDEVHRSTVARLILREYRAAAAGTSAIAALERASASTKRALRAALR